MRPILTTRLSLREMTPADLDDMAALLGDPTVMRYYPEPKDRAAALRWIEWNQRNYSDHGFGLWVVETHDGEFVGDCGLTMQSIGGRDGSPVVEVEVGYHVRSDLHGLGYATEAAEACREFARRLGITRLVAIIDPQNLPSQRVAERIGLAFEYTDATGLRIYAGELQQQP